MRTLRMTGWEGPPPEPGDLLALGFSRVPHPDGMPPRLYLVLRAEERPSGQLLVTCQPSGPQPAHWRPGRLQPPRFPLGRQVALWPGAPA